MTKATRLELVLVSLQIASEEHGNLHQMAMALAMLASDGFFTLVHSSEGDFLIDNTTGRPIDDNFDDVDFYLMLKYMTDAGLDAIPFEVDILALPFVTKDGMLVEAYDGCPL